MTPLNLSAVALTLALVACQHPRSESQVHSAASPSRDQGIAAPTQQMQDDASVLPRPTDERKSCRVTNAVCSGTPSLAGAEAMESAASLPGAPVPAIAEYRVSAQSTGVRDQSRAMLYAPVAVAVAGGQASPVVDTLSNAATGIGHWYAWVAVLALLVLVVRWSRRRLRTRLASLSPGTPARSEDSVAAPGMASALDSAGDDIVTAAQSAKDAHGAILSVPLQRLTFAPVYATDDATDRQVGLPRGERQSPKPSSVPGAQVERGQQAGALAEAKRHLAAARPEDALQLLESLLGQSQPPAEAWVVAGWAWWRMAQEAQDSTVLAQATSAAHAFTQAWLIEPGRADLLTRIARCHLLRARHADDDSMRQACLDQAVERFAKRSALRVDEPADQLELAQTAALRANTCARGDAAEQQWWQRAAHHLAQIPQAHHIWQDDTAIALRIDVQLGLAASATGEESVRQHGVAVEQLRRALANAHETDVDVWLAKLIDAVRSKIKHQSGGGRLLTLQSLQADVSPYLHHTRTVVPMLAWINLLDDWARLLPAHAAQAKLAEADYQFERASQMPSQGPTGLQFARAYYLRTRSQHEQGAGRLRTLQQAHRILAELPDDALPASFLKQELAEIELALARQSEGHCAIDHYGRAVAAATQAADGKTRAGMAWHCAAQALLGLAGFATLDEQQRTQLSALATQLETAADNQPDMLRTAAEIRLHLGDFASSSRICEAAWNAGATRAQVLSLWQQADAEWARTVEHANDDAGWQYLHQRLRLASTIY